MLYSPSEKEVTKVGHRREFDLRRSNLSDADYKAAVEAITAYVDKVDRSFTSSHIPGKDWTGTAYQPLYLACGQSMEQAAMFFGQIVWKAMIEHPDAWIFVKPDKDLDEIIGMTYFRKDN